MKYMKRITSKFRFSFIFYFNLPFLVLFYGIYELNNSIFAKYKLVRSLR